ncbi:YARHG domain-containing protein [Neolewinella lacunae]|uniref:YARHG domain-containing protein n=1 Tax=Neolewinella lacunae TaxID=1517758 RepID=A0A923T6R9_9BACT|nr:YARHG domain-containing protein [Neolewinella lacunae]MBC6993715.1 YARHG domain-containing protein [Neolewinella lacunae]MDN3635741.1 YARHG domain-containing protein [Neolewinella lacunae]
MKTLLSFLLLAVVLTACGNPTKNSDASVIVEPGTDTAAARSTDPAPVAVDDENAEFLGSWVGYFRKGSADEHDYDEKTLYVDEGYVWNRENKINISIDKIVGDSVFGHSVVAGNDRPFSGHMFRDRMADPQTFMLREPGDDKYDGIFTFFIEDGRLQGTWEAYGNINVKKRQYQLEKKTFAYNPDQQLEPAKTFVDWTKKVNTKKAEDFGDGEFYEWMQEEYASATPAIYEINASSRLLTKAEVENLKKGDLTIIRNTIYARHGYSFKHRPLRVFFDAQPWYIPVHTDIRADFTDIEKQNIKLLLSYEKNAAEYYDSFGRG